MGFGLKSVSDPQELFDLFLLIRKPFYELPIHLVHQRLRADRRHPAHGGSTKSGAVGPAGQISAGRWRIFRSGRNLRRRCLDTLFSRL